MGAFGWTALSLVILLWLVVPICVVYNFYMDVIYPVDIAKEYLIAAMSVNDARLAKIYLEKAFERLEPYSGYVGLWYTPEHSFDVLKERIKVEIDACEKFSRVPQESYEYQRFMEELKDELKQNVETLEKIGWEMWYFSTTHFPINFVVGIIYAVAAGFAPFIIGCIVEDMVEERKRKRGSRGAWR